MDIAPRRILVPAKHRVDSILKFNVVCLVNAAGVHPEIAKAVALSLLRAESNLFVASLALSVIVL